MDRPLRSVLIMCLLEHLHKLLGNIQEPLLNKAKEQLAQGWEVAIADLEPLIGSPDCRRPGPTLSQEVVEVLSRVIPLLGTPFMVNRFHANGGLKGKSNKVVAFQLEISNRTPGCQDVWQVLEKLRGLSALQLIGIQLKRD